MARNADTELTFEEALALHAVHRLEHDGFPPLLSLTKISDGFWRAETCTGDPHCVWIPLWGQPHEHHA